MKPMHVQEMVSKHVNNGIKHRRYLHKLTLGKEDQRGKAA